MRPNTLTQALELYGVYQTKVRARDIQIEVILKRFKKNAASPKNKLLPTRQRRQLNAPAFDARGALHAMPSLEWPLSTRATPDRQAALRHSLPRCAATASLPCVLRQPLNAIGFLAWVTQFLVPTLRAGDVVIMDNLSSHKRQAIRAAIRAAGALLLLLPAYSPD